MNIKETLASIDNALTHPAAAKDALKECRSMVNWQKIELEKAEKHVDNLCREFDALSSDEDLPPWAKTRIREILHD